MARSEPSTSTSNFTKRSNSGAFRYRRRSNTSVDDLPWVRDSKSPNQSKGRRMRASMALEPKSHCDSRTPRTEDAHSRVSVSLGSQSCADAESDHRMTPTWVRGQESSAYRSK